MLFFIFAIFIFFRRFRHFIFDIIFITPLRFSILMPPIFDAFDICAFLSLSPFSFTPPRRHFRFISPLFHAADAASFAAAG
jgi:hypothetical protein